MPEAVDQAVASHPGPLLQPLDHGGDGLRRQPFALFGEPEPVRIRLGTVRQVTVERLHRLTLQGDHPRLRPLARHPKMLKGRVEVGEFDAGQLGEPYPGIAEKGDDGLVAGAEEAGPEAVLLLTGLEHGQHLGVGVRLHLADVSCGELEPPDAVFGEVILLVGRPAEQPLDCPAVSVDGSRVGPAGRGARGVSKAPAFVVAADVVKELADVVAGDFRGRLWPAALVGVPAEML